MFAAYYGAMTEEELLRLAANQESLAPNARAAFSDELRRRGREDLIAPSPSRLGTEGRKRHGCLTAYLICLVIVTSMSALIFLLISVQRYYPNAPGWTKPMAVILSLTNLAWPFALLRWKRWGFWGFCGSSVVGVVFNLTVGLGMLQSIAGLLGILVLYGVLRIGGVHDGWSQLE